MDIHKYYVSSTQEISCCHLNLPQEYIQDSIKEIYRLGDSMNHQTNVKAIMTTYHVWNETRQFDLAFQTITNTLNKTYPILDSRFEYCLENGWAAIYKKGNMTVTHDHLPYQYSWVYYLQATENSSPLVFPTCNNFSVFPTNSLLTMFPSYLPHFVPEEQDDTDRICLVGNVSWKHKNTPQ